MTTSTNGRFLKIDGSFSRPIDWNAINLSAPAFPGLGGPMPASPQSRTISPATVAPANPAPQQLPTNQPTQQMPQNMPQQTPQNDPSTSFNTLMMDLLKSAQGVGTADLLKRKRELERESVSRTSAPTDASLRTLSPSQQSAIRSGSVNALSPEIDANSYELEKAQQSIDNFFRVFGEAQKISSDFADKMVAPDSIIKNAQQLIQSDSSKMSTILAGFNDKSKASILGGLDYSKMKDPTKELDDEYKRAQIAKLRYETSGSPATGTTPGVLSPLAQSVQNGTIKIESLPSKQRASVAAELAVSGIPSSRQQTLSSDLQVVNDLMDNPDHHKISGFLQGKLKFGNLDPSAQLALNQYEQLKGTLSLENREKLKGSGAISDFEFKVLSQAATALGRNISDAEFDSILGKIKDIFEGKYQGTAAGGAFSSQPLSMKLDGQILYLQPNGTYE